MFITKIKCPRCGGDHVCVEVIKSSIFPEGQKFCAGWVNGEAVAYCYNCDEGELAAKAEMKNRLEERVKASLKRS
jgi:hypothetical protein